MVRVKPAASVKGKKKDVVVDVAEDPKLTKDVSNFLNDLKLGKDPEASTSSHPPSKSDKKQKKFKSAKTPPGKKHPAAVQDPETKPDPIVLPKKLSLNTSKSHFTFPPDSQWYAALPTLPSAASSPPTPAQLQSLMNKAADLHSQDISAFQSSSTSSSEASFMSKIIQSGTLSDRLSALTLMVQSSPLHNIKALETLKGMAGKGGREESLKALRCVVDWWVGGGSPDRKLKYFRDQPLLHPNATDAHILVWYFEDWLKKYFFSVLQILESLSLDPLPYIRTQALRLIFTLLKDKPEQEQNLLRLLVNKLGDTEKSLCSRASHHLLQVLQAHPSMKGVIVREITGLVLKPPPPVVGSVESRRIKFTDRDDDKKRTQAKKKEDANGHARYYSTITLNQIVLTPQDKDVAMKLVEVYFDVFREVLGEPADPTVEEEQGGDKGGGEEEVKKDSKGRILERRRGKKGKGKEKEKANGDVFTELEDANSKLISAVLTGVNRALPFVKDSVALEKHINTLFLITHQSTFNTSLQALVLIQQLSPLPADRYYRTLYASLLDSRLSDSSKHAMYLNLLFKSIKADDCVERMKAFVKRFLQVLVSGGEARGCEWVAGGVYLVGELLSSVPGLRTMVTQQRNDDDNDDESKPLTTSYDPKKRDPKYAAAETEPLWEIVPLLNHYHPSISLHAHQLLLGKPLTASPDLSLNTLSHFLDRFVFKNPKKVNRDGAGVVKGGSAMQPSASNRSEGVRLVKGEVSEKDVRGLGGREQDVREDEMFYWRYFKGKRKGRNQEDAGDEEEEGEESGDEQSGDEEIDLTGDEDERQGGEEEEEEEEEEDLEEDEVWKAMKASMPKVDGEDSMDDSDDSDVDIDDDSDLGDLGSNGEYDEDADHLSLAENSDDDDLVSLVDFEGGDDDGEEEEWGGICAVSKKRKRDEAGEGKKKKKAKKNLPTFASYEDYAKMIEAGGEDED